MAGVSCAITSSAKDTLGCWAHMVVLVVGKSALELEVCNEKSRSWKCAKCELSKK